MRWRKIYMVLIILVVLSIVFVGLNLVRGKDTSRFQLETIFYTNARITALSQEASTKASSYDLKIAAASLVATAASDNTQLSAYYKNRYAKAPEEMAESKDPKDPLNVLKVAAPADFDVKYRQLIQVELEQNLPNLSNLFNQTERPELRGILSKTFDNQTAALETLKTR